MSNLPVIADVEIPVDAEGRYNLNAIHRASGLGAGKAPSQWSKLFGSKNLVALEGDGSLVSKEGHEGGTWATKLLAISYAMWLGGPSFVATLVDKLAELDNIIKALDEFEVPTDVSDMYVYAIKEEGGAIKLGISKNPEERLKQLQVGNSRKLTLVAKRKAENRFNDERSLHMQHDIDKIRSEWFDAGAIDVWNMSDERLSYWFSKVESSKREEIAAQFMSICESLDGQFLDYCRAVAELHGTTLLGLSKEPAPEFTYSVYTRRWRLLPDSLKLSHLALCAKEAKDEVIYFMKKFVMSRVVEAEAAYLMH